MVQRHPLIFVLVIALLITACTPNSSNEVANTQTVEIPTETNQAVSSPISGIGVSNEATLYAISTPDADATLLVALEEQARQVAQKSRGEILRQVDTDITTIDFRFVDRALSREVTIVIPKQNAPVEKWNTEVNTVSPLLTYPSPDMDLTALKIGPERVAEAAAGHWKGCRVRTMTLYLENEKLTWLVFCNVLDGVVSGIMDNATGAFQPSNAPPARIPGIATAVP